VNIATEQHISISIEDCCLNGMKNGYFLKELAHTANVGSHKFTYFGIMLTQMIFNFFFITYTFFTEGIFFLVLHA